MGDRGRASNLGLLREDPRGRGLGLDLPPGRLVFETAMGVLDQPIAWISDAGPDVALWADLRARHQRTGLWPLLVDVPPETVGDAAWFGPELVPVASRPEDHDPAALLAARWADYTAPGGGDTLSPAERLAVTAPFEARWPGLAGAGRHQEDPDGLAEQFARHLLADSDPAALRLALSASRRSADAPADLGWSGPVNYGDDTAEFAAVLSGWEERFGARLVAIGSDTLHLSVAAPPTEPDHALHVAAEHFAFCPDTVWQATTHDLVGYAEALTGRLSWSFWWD